MYKFMYLLSKLWKMRRFSVENPSLFTMRGSSSDRKSLKRCVSYCYLEVSFLVAICNSRYKRKFTNLSYKVNRGNFVTFVKAIIILTIFTLLEYGMHSRTPCILGHSNSENTGANLLKTSLNILGDECIKMM